MLAYGHALAAAHALVVVYHGLVVLVHGEGPVSAVAYADTAAHTVFAVYHRFGIAVHLQFSAHGTATHAIVRVSHGRRFPSDRRLLLPVHARRLG